MAAGGIFLNYTLGHIAPLLNSSVALADPRKMHLAEKDRKGGVRPSSLIALHPPTSEVPGTPTCAISPEALLALHAFAEAVSCGHRLCEGMRPQQEALRVWKSQ